VKFPRPEYRIHGTCLAASLFRFARCSFIRFDRPIELAPFARSEAQGYVLSSSVANGILAARYVATLGVEMAEAARCREAGGSPLNLSSSH